MILKKTEFPYCEKFSSMLCGFEDSVIFSILEGICGAVFCDDEKNPVVAAACYKDFCFICGKPQEISNLKDIVFYYCDNPVLIADNKGWEKYFEDCFDFKRQKRFKMKAPPSFDIKSLEKISCEISRHPQLEMRIMNETDYESFDPRGWEHDMRGCYKDKEDFVNKSFGVIISDKGKNQIICGATAYTYYSRGIEIQIETKKEYRNKGLASIAAAALLIQCEKRGVKAHWDAAHMQSAGLAMKLGLELKSDYEAYGLKKQI